MRMFGLDVRPVANKPNEYYACCPFCVRRGEPTPDTKFKLGFNTKKGIYHCYRCGAKGRLKDVEELSIFSDYDSEQSTEELRNRLNSLFNKKSKPLLNINLDVISWPIDKENTPIAYQYMINRGYSEEELIKYSVRVGKTFWDESREINNSKWAGRIIFPFFYEGDCIYAVGRSYSNKQPRYLNETLPKGLVVYGIDNIQDNECILCEGIISAHAAERFTGVSAVSVLGKNPLPLQIERIASKCNKVYQSLDGDVEEEESKRLTRQLLKAGLEVWEIKIPPGTDPDDLKADYKQYFDKAQKVSLI